MKKINNYIRYHILETLSIIGFIIIMASSKPMFALLIPLVWVLLYLITYIIFSIGSSRITGTYKYYSTHVFGFRRKGKDLSIQHYVIKRFKKNYNKIVKKHDLDTNEKIKKYFHEKPLYLSLMDYGYGCRVVSLKEFELINLHTNKHVTYKEFMEGLPISVKKLPWAEGKQLIIPETQLGLPNTEHNTLDKLYPWLPVFIALAGHLYDMEIHINSQEFERPWVKIRNQQDYYINALNLFPRAKTWLDYKRAYFPIIRNGLIQRVRTYQKSESAKNGMLPFDALGLVNEMSKPVMLSAGQATKEVYEASNGEIKQATIFTKFKDLRYDTRYYHEVVFGSKIERKTNVKIKRNNGAKKASICRITSLQKWAKTLTKRHKEKK